MSGPGRKALHEGAHKVPASDAEVDARSAKRNFNEAAHKLGYYPAGPAPVREHVPSDAIP